jgi:putative ABC transport system permease protein
LESVTLSLIGGIMGVVLGILVSLLVALFAEWDFKIFILPPIIGFLVSVAIGIFFGFYPAYTASRLDPIQTLRSE